MRHGPPLGIVGVIVSLTGALFTWDARLGAQWYALGLVVVSLPCVGGRTAAPRQILDAHAENREAIERFAW